MSRDKPPSETDQPTDAEFDQRVAVCHRLLGEGERHGEVKRKVAALFKLSPRTVERYLRRARAEIVAATGQSRPEHVADSYAFYAAMAAKKDAEDRDRIRARERIDKLLGLEAPQKLQHGADPDNPLPTPILRIVEPAAAPDPTIHVNGHR